MRKVILAVVLVAVVVAGLVFSLRTHLGPWIAARAVERNLRNDLGAAVPDGLHLALCGAGAPLPDPERSGPCVAVIAGRTTLIVDSGSGGARNLNRMGVPVGKVAAVLLTHFHSDHIDGLGELAMMRWVGAAHREPLPVFGPPGVEEIVAGFNKAYRMDAGYRAAHHGEAVAPLSGAGMVPRPFVAPPAGEPVEVWNADGLRVTAFTVSHSPVEPAVGYRFDYGGRSLVLSGDTKKSPTVEAQAAGVDLLVHEALDARLVAGMNRGARAAGNPLVEKITADIPDYHTTPVEAAETAAAAGVDALLYYHIVPPLPLRLFEAVFLDGVADVFPGPVVVGRDGTFVSLPAGSAAIEFSDLL